jgi:hypothetical protein
MSELKRREPGVRQLVLALDSKTDFKQIVNVLERTLTFKDIPGIHGCAPCLSGIDRIVIEDLAANQ